MSRNKCCVACSVASLYSLTCGAGIWTCHWDGWSISIVTKASLPISSGGSQLDVQRCDSQLFAALSHILSGQHGGVRRRLVSVGLHLHAAGHTADGLPRNHNTPVQSRHPAQTWWWVTGRQHTFQTDRWRGQRCRWRKRRCDKRRRRSLPRPPEDPDWWPAPPSSPSLYEEPLSVGGTRLVFNAKDHTATWDGFVWAASLLLPATQSSVWLFLQMRLKPFNASRVSVNGGTGWTGHVAPAQNPPNSAVIVLTRNQAFAQIFGQWKLQSHVIITAS